MGTMLAAVLHGINDLRLEQVAVPRAVKPGQVVVRIHSCGVCATDWKAVNGKRRNVTFPFIAGHEPSGVVAEVGPGVSHFAPGDAVIVQPSGYCGFSGSAGSATRTIASMLLPRVVMVPGTSGLVHLLNIC